MADIESFIQYLPLFFPVSTGENSKNMSLNGTKTLFALIVPDLSTGYSSFTRITFIS